MKFLENQKTLAAIVANIEKCEETFKDLESMSCSLNRNEQKDVIVDIVASFDVDKILVNIQEDLILYGEDKFLPHGEKKFSFILEQMKEIRKTFDYMIESFSTNFLVEDEKLVMKIACSLNMSKLRKKGNEVLSSKKKESVSLDYEEITKKTDKASEEILKKTSRSLKELQEEIKKKHSDDDFFKKFFGEDKEDLF